jgi:aromatic-L-amino-acid decarboxylase
MHGIGPFRRNLDEKLDLAAWATEELRGIPGVEILAEPQLSIVAFRWRGEGYNEGALNGVNRELLERINGRKRIYLTGTMLGRPSPQPSPVGRGSGDRFAIRICVLSFRTHAERLREGIEDIRSAIAAIQDRPSP